MYKIKTQAQPEAKEIYLEADTRGGILLIVEGFYVLKISAAGKASLFPDVSNERTGLDVDKGGYLIISGAKN